MNPSAGSRDGNAATDSFTDGVVHAVRVEVLAFRKVGGMLMLNETTDAKGVMKAAYNNPLDIWRSKAIEFPYLARVARRVLAIPAMQAKSERMFWTAGLTVNKRCGLLEPENVEFLVFLRCNGAAVDEWQLLEERPGLTLRLLSAVRWCFA